MTQCPAEQWVARRPRMDTCKGGKSYRVCDGKTHNSTLTSCKRKTQEVRRTQPCQQCKTRTTTPHTMRLEGAGRWLWVRRLFSFCNSGKQTLEGP
jgi:hypothetical protein